MRRRDLMLAAALLGGPPLVRAADSMAQLAAGFIDTLATRHGFDRAELGRVFAGLKVDQRVIKLLSPPETPGERVTWADYRSRHLKRTIIANGRDFMRTHAAELAAAAARYGPPAEIITAILGVETRYGTYTGRFRTVETLATLAFAYPPRADFFRDELEQLFLYAREQGLAVGKLAGSYAGAMGYPQFLPSSARKWAVDMDGDGVADLFNFADAIGSVGNFLREHGWERGVEVAWPVAELHNADPQALLDAGIVPSLTPADFKAAGMPVGLPDGTDFDGPLALVDLVNKDTVEYRAGTINYYALTRYNRSNNYAMSVLDLAREVAQG